MNFESPDILFAIIIAILFALSIVLTKALSALNFSKEENEILIPHYGHQESKSGVVTEEEYNKIKERKVYDLEDSIYDYFVDTNTSLSNLYEQLTNIKNQIQQKYN